MSGSVTRLRMMSHDRSSWEGHGSLGSFIILLLVLVSTMIAMGFYEWCWEDSQEGGFEGDDGGGERQGGVTGSEMGSEK